MNYFHQALEKSKEVASASFEYLQETVPPALDKGLEKSKEFGGIAKEKLVEGYHISKEKASQASEIIKEKAQGMMGHNQDTTSVIDQDNSHPTNLFPQNEPNLNHQQKPSSMKMQEPPMQSYQQSAPPTVPSQPPSQ
ncbi:hypothetical protein DFA_02114 [Cavenderia fasciculata]|uniref:Uncharacterized protein n=1 Tax=Cavenderia fasciculata TaxID=261658 RepID=F4PYR1_CACFS|nr:uncharacterized protein DFA_02114 [Cavenderia fasciculata]EGG19327.1 hypothetical protein DFA_02114 [Cavenderia fasciculata]|eukprot:XP_004357598.1 hypothetical protein DFA_02114 [Cavenderia fasciculata]